MVGWGEGRIFIIFVTARGHILTLNKMEDIKQRDWQFANYYNSPHCLCARIGVRKFVFSLQNITLYDTDHCPHGCHVI